MQTEVLLFLGLMIFAGLWRYWYVIERYLNIDRRLVISAVWASVIAFLPAWFMVELFNGLLGQAGSSWEAQDYSIFVMIFGAILAVFWIFIHEWMGWLDKNDDE